MPADCSYLIDSHCHIHDAQFGFDVDAVVQEARQQDVRQLVCIGTSGEDSERAVQFAENYVGVFASVGLHPHEAKLGEDDLEMIARLGGHKKVVAIGEFGLDYHYNHSPRDQQLMALEYQLQIAQSLRLPCIFHVREAFDDFWAVLDNFPGTRGVVHSFSASITEVEEACKRGLYVGLNGIMTFTRDESQLAAAQKIPLSNMMLETDAPFLTPPPLRGKMNVPANVRLVAACLAEMRGDSLDELIEATTRNTQALFSLDPSDTL